MPHSLTRLHRGPHLYGPGGNGWRALDMAPFVRPAGTILKTIDMPGFVERNVTYKSHHFWLHFLGLPNATRFGDVLIVVNHGGGWEVWRGDYLLAESLARYGDDTRGLFKLCWCLLDIAEAAQEDGARETADRYRHAFVEGRLKKRKLPARGAVKVWIEDAPAAPAPAPAATNRPGDMAFAFAQETGCGYSDALVACNMD